MSKTLIFKPSKLLIWPFSVAITCFGILAASSIVNQPVALEFVAGFWAVVVITIFVIIIDLKRLNQERYTIGDNSIQVQTHHDDSTISLVSIDGVTGIPYMMLRYRKMGRIVITANGQTYAMRGMEDASSRAALIWQAVQAVKNRRDEHNRPNYFIPPSHAAGTLEIMNDLVGLWQQGMMTDEQYTDELHKLTVDNQDS